MEHARARIELNEGRLRRILTIGLLVLLLVALDVLLNEGRVSGAIYSALVEFIRVTTRTLTQGG